jgi:hypothetical protein
MATLVGIVSVVVNVGVSFMTDGNWKTAGTGLAQFYWKRTKRARHGQPEPRLPHRFTWSPTVARVPGVRLPQCSWL